MVAAYRSFSTGSASNGANIVVTKPAGTVDGDLLVAVSNSASAGQTVTAPAGWTQLQALTAARLFIKPALSEGASYTFSQSVLASSKITMVAVSGVAASNPVDDSDGVVGTGALIIPSLDLIGSDRLLLQIAAHRAGGTWSGPGTATERFDDIDGTSSYASAAGDEVVGYANATGSTGTRTWTPSITGSPGVAFMLAIAPTAPTSPTYQSHAHSSATLGNNIVVTKPAGTVDGDGLVAFWTNANPGNALTPPAGWTLKAGATTTDAIYSKVASGEGASYTWTPGFLAGGKIVIVRVNGQLAGSNFVAATSILAFANATNFVIPQLTSPGAGYQLLQVIGTTGTSTFTPPGGTTERFESNDSGSLTAAGGDEIVGSGATGSRTWVSSVANNGAGFMVAISPPSVSNTVNAVTATATAAAQVPAVTVAASVTGVAATATAAAQAPAVTGVANPTVNAVTATATAAAGTSRFTRAPVLISDYGHGSTGTNSSYASFKPLGVKLGDILVQSFLMNGAPTIPTGWQLLDFAAGFGDNANVLLWARVDGVTIPAADDGQFWIFGDGGGALYYTQSIALVRFARPVGNPFDGLLAANGVVGPRNTSLPLSLTTTHNDDLLYLSVSGLYGVPSVTAATSPLQVAVPAGNYIHTAAGEQVTAGPTGDQYLTYSADQTYIFAHMSAIRPDVVESPTVNAVPATATAAAHAPTVSGTQNPTVNAVAATATAAAQAPVVSGTQNPTVNAVTATATAEAVAPTVSAATNATVDAVAAAATAQAHAPTVNAIANPTVNAVTATATAAALPPAVSSSATVSAIAATATAAAIAPTTIVDASIDALAATATAEANAPSFSGSSSVTAVAATASAAAVEPAISISIAVEAVVAIATAQAAPPTLNVTATIIAITALATAEARPPVYVGELNIPTGDLVGTVRDNRSTGSIKDNTYTAKITSRDIRAEIT